MYSDCYILYITHIVRIQNKNWRDKKIGNELKKAANCNTLNSNHISYLHFHLNLALMCIFKVKPCKKTCCNLFKISFESKAIRRLQNLSRLSYSPHYPSSQPKNNKVNMPSDVYTENETRRAYIFASK